MTEAGDGPRFDVDGPGERGKLWGLPFTEDDAALVILPVPWEATVSYGAGTAAAPAAILEASTQVDLYDSEFPDTWKRGIAMAPIPEDLHARGEEIRRLACSVIDTLSAGDHAVDQRVLDEVNTACDEMVAHVRRESERLLEVGKLVAVLGGDHSVPLGLLQALGERHQGFGILHIDAHCDLRVAYEGFVHSHASIMHNALSIPAITKIVQVGIRDYSDQELASVGESNGRIELFDFRGLTKRRFAGEGWASLTREILAALPQQVYVSFDIDGLDPSLCPGTGTPVPGGLAFEEALHLVGELTTTGHEILGFDLCEVSAGGDRGGEWDANVGARVLYRLSCAALGGG